MLETSIRGSVEEIGFHPLHTNNTDFRCFYLGTNSYYGITVDLKYFVYSQLFLVCDFKNKFSQNLTLSPNEISHVVPVDISYFMRLGYLIKSNKDKDKNKDFINYDWNVNKCNLKEEEQKYYR